VAAIGFYELGEVRRLRGDLRSAQECYDRARALGIEPQPGEAMLQHATGRTDEAIAGLRIALTEPGRLARARVMEEAVEIGLAAGQADWAESLAAELESTAAFYGTPGLLAAGDRARAAVLVASGAPADALPLLERAASIYRAQRHQHATARVHEALATAYRRLGRDDRAAAAEATARAIHARLGAHAELARLGPRTNPGGLTEREVEVLREVSSGRTNRQVAASLVISEKTVSRHLASIFTKTGVTSRTAAAAWAREQHLV
jgi:DNA-binding NarL/FixJ family response regulator